MTEPSGPDSSPAEIASNLIGKEMLEAMVAELEATATPFRHMSEADQHVVIERLRGRVRSLITQAMQVLFSGQYPACPATLTSLRVGGSSSRGSIEIPKNAMNRHELMDRVGRAVVVLMVDPDEHLKDIEQVKAKQKQHDLFTGQGGPLIPHVDIPDVDPALRLNEEGGDTDTPATPEDPARWVVTANDPNVERHLDTGNERRSTRALASDLIEKLQAVNMDSKLDSVDYDQEEIYNAPRGQVVLGLLWVDTYSHGLNEDSLARPDFIRRTA